MPKLKAVRSIYLLIFPSSECVFVFKKNVFHRSSNSFCKCYKLNYCSQIFYSLTQNIPNFVVFFFSSHLIKFAQNTTRCGKPLRFIDKYLNLLFNFRNSFQPFFDKLHFSVVSHKINKSTEKII